MASLAYLLHPAFTLQVGQPVAVVEQGAEAAPAAEAPADDKPAEEKPKAEAKNVPAAEQKGDKPEAPPPPPPPKPKPKPEPAKAPQPSKAESAVRGPHCLLGCMDLGRCACLVVQGLLHGMDLGWFVCS